jgi:hypothetical protein
MKCPKKLRPIRKAYWIFHEVFSMVGHVIWLDHKIQEIKELAEDNGVILE